MYPKGLFENAPKVNLKKGEISLDELLKLSISQNELNFELTQDNVIVIKRNLMNSVLNELPIKGKIVDEDGIPILGANIIEKGTTNGVISDLDGNFKISVSNKNSQLIISYIGFVTQEITVLNKSDFYIVLKTDVGVMDEVVVVGYGKQTKQQIVGAVSTVKGASVSFANRNLTNNIA